jgi:hypothetical protein
MAYQCVARLVVRKTVSQVLRKEVLDRRDFTAQLMGFDRGKVPS